MKYDFSDLTKQLQALNNKLHSQIVNFSGIDEKGMRLEYYNNTYINVDDMNSLQNNVLYITGLPASGKFYNSMLKNEKISMIIVNPSLNTIIQNRITRDGVDKHFAEQQTKEEF